MNVYSDLISRFNNYMLLQPFSNEFHISIKTPNIKTNIHHKQCYISAYVIFHIFLTKSHKKMIGEIATMYTLTKETYIVHPNFSW